MIVVGGVVVWTSEDGRETPVSEMADRHLENTIIWLKKKIDEEDAKAYAAARFTGDCGLAEHAMSEAFDKAQNLGQWLEYMEYEVNRRATVRAAFKAPAYCKGVLVHEHGQK